jgi:hypothetical protein
MTNWLLLKISHENNKGLQEKKCGEWLLRALADNFLGLIRSPIKGFTRIMADQLGQL